MWNSSIALHYFEIIVDHSALALRHLWAYTEKETLLSEQ